MNPRFSISAKQLNNGIYYLLGFLPFRKISLADTRRDRCEHPAGTSDILDRLQSFVLDDTGFNAWTRRRTGNDGLGDALKAGIIRGTNPASVSRVRFHHEMRRKGKCFG